MLHSSARKKGNSLEYDVEYSLKPIYSDIKTTERRGFAQGFDLIAEQKNTVFECKFHKSITWNELVKIYEILRSRTQEAVFHWVIFKTNQQPVLVFDGKSIRLFKDIFGVEFKNRPKREKNIWTQ